jgi:hypothetical protein
MMKANLDYCAVNAVTRLQQRPKRKRQVRTLRRVYDTAMPRLFLEPFRDVQFAINHIPNEALELRRDRSSAAIA